MKYLYLFLWSLTCSPLHAQYALFADEAIISYDKTMYIKNIANKQYLEKVSAAEKPQFQVFIADAPEQVVLKKILKIKGKETLFEPIKQELEPKTKKMLTALVLDLEATTLSNLETKAYARFNDMIGQKVIIQDTLKKIDWRITDEYREIAGYNCRRANGITKDSTYVIGYYCNELPVSGGPESINGLPGTILGLVIPSQHVSYFATKVELTNGLVLDKKLFENQKVKKLNRAEVSKMMKETFSKFLNGATVDYVIKLALM